MLPGGGEDAMAIEEVDGLKDRKDNHNLMNLKFCQRCGEQSQLLADVRCAALPRL